MGKMKKVLQKYEKTNHSQVKCFLYIEKQKSMQFPKLETCKLWIYLVRETYGRTPKVPKVIKYSKGFGFLYILHYSYFARNRNRYNSENTGNNWILGKHKHSKVMGFLHISCVTLIQTIPKRWEKWIPKVRKKYGKTNISKLRISEIFSLKQKSMQFPKYGKSGFP